MRALGWMLMAGVWACGPYAGAADSDGSSGSPPELGSSLNVRVVDDSVRFEIHVTNVAAGPLALEFATLQRYDFEVSTRDGTRIWRWSDGMMFGQATGREVLEPGESRRYTAAWSGEGRTGEFVAAARVVSTNYPVELRTGFRLPAE